MGCSLNLLLLRPGWTPGSRGFPPHPAIASSRTLLGRLPETHKGSQMEFWAMYCCALGPRPAGSRHCKSLALPWRALSAVLARGWQQLLAYGRGEEGQTWSPCSLPSWLPHFAPYLSLFSQRGPGRWKGSLLFPTQVLGSILISRWHSEVPRTQPSFCISLCRLLTCDFPPLAL